MKTWIQTARGSGVNLLAPKSDTIFADDIAHALSQICRFTGHTREHYSVAQHCVLVAEQLPPPMRIHGLLHDAHEAYWGDLSYPVKLVLRNSLHCTGFDQVVARTDAAIYAAFGIEQPSELVHAAVKAADIRLLMTERRDLMAPPPEDWDFEAYAPIQKTIHPWTAREAKHIFLDRLRRYAPHLNVPQALAA